MKKELITLTAIAATGLATTVSANEVTEPNVDNAGGVRTAQTEPAINVTDAKTEPALVEKEAPKKVEVKVPTKEVLPKHRKMKAKQKKSWIKRMKLLVKQKRKSLT